MTQQIRTTIEPKDVKAVEIECNHCHFRIVRPIDNWLRDTSMCPNGQEQWGSNHSHVLGAVKELAEYLQMVSVRTKEGLPFTIRLEVEGLDKP